MSDNILIDVSTTLENVNVEVIEASAASIGIEYFYPAGPQGIQGPQGPVGPQGQSLWGTISGTLSTQTDLWKYLSAVGTSNFDIATLNNYLSTTPTVLSSLNVNGQILSAGIPLHNIFLTSETDSQTLSYIASSYLLSISNGNTVNLSSINTTFASNSGKYENVYNNVVSNSANWQQAYNTATVYQSNSSLYATVSYVNNNFFPLSGGIISGPTRINNNLTVFGNLTASGTTTFANTVFSVTSALSVVHIGSGPAVWIGNNGDGDIASFYDIDQGIEILHVGGNNGSFPNVGVKTSTPNKDFTVKGEISASNTIYDATGNSIQWNEAYNVATIVQANSANWEESAEILPTVTNYLSTSNVLISAVTVTTDISAQGLVYSRSLTPNLPVPKIILLGSTSIEYLALYALNWLVEGNATLLASPVLKVADFTQEDLNNNQIFIEMVIFKKKKRNANAGRQADRTYVVPIGSAVKPWGTNFWQRGGSNPSGLLATRYNHLPVTSLNEKINLGLCLNAHFRQRDVAYLDPTSTNLGDARYLTCLTPFGSKSLWGGYNDNYSLRSKITYSRSYRPLYIAFRYICWLPNNNNGRGQIISGPLSPTIRVGNTLFPFDINHYQSSLKGFPVYDLNPSFTSYNDVFQCKFS